jgi:hypothetical protein
MMVEELEEFDFDNAAPSRSYYFYPLTTNILMPYSAKSLLTVPRLEPCSSQGVKNLVKLKAL